MKKILIILVAIISFGISVNAQTTKKRVAFREEQKLCEYNKNSNSIKEQIFFYKDATFKIYSGQVLIAQGFYNYKKATDTKNATITLTGERENGKGLDGKNAYEIILDVVVDADSGNLTLATFNQIIYRRCK